MDTMLPPLSATSTAGWLGRGLSTRAPRGWYLISIFAAEPTMTRILWDSTDIGTEEKSGVSDEMKAIV
jgi:hypothetical protein